MPVEAVRWGMAAAAAPDGARVLEVGAGAGQLTVALLEAGLDVVALEPGPALRALAAERAPAVRYVGARFEDWEPDGRYDAVVSANAWHWVDPAVGYPKAAEAADALVLVWDTPFPADPALLRRVQREVMHPRGSTFPDDEAGVRAVIETETAAGREELRASGCFDEPRWCLLEQRLVYTAERYAALLQSLSSIARLAPDVRAEIADGLRAALGAEPFEVLDLVYVAASRSVRRAAPSRGR